MDRGIKASLGDRLERTYDLFGQMGRYCRDSYGIEVLMHPERCSLIETEQDLARLMDRGLSTCFDNDHYAAANGGWQRGDECSRRKPGRRERYTALAVIRLSPQSAPKALTAPSSQRSSL